MALETRLLVGAWVAGVGVWIVYLIGLGEYKIPLGTDGVTAFYPVAKALDQSSSPAQFLNLLVAGYMGEDHLTPVRNLIGFFSYKLNQDPIIATSVISKLFFFLIFWRSLTIARLLWHERTRTLVFFLFLSANLYLTREHFIWANFSIAVFFSLSAFYWSIRFFKSKQYHALLLSLWYLTLALLTNENSFLALGYLFFYSLFFHLRKRSPFLENPKVVCSFLFTLFISATPYFVIHYWIYGTILPSSRVGLLLDGSSTKSLFDATYPLIKVIGWTISGWAFGILNFANNWGIIWKLFCAVFLFLALICTVRLRAYSRIGLILAASLVCVLPVIAYTGRTGAGMWLFGGIVLNLIFSDVFSTFLQRTTSRFHSHRGTYATYSLKACLIIALAGMNFLGRPYEFLDEWYRDRSAVGIAAYQTINSDPERLVYVRLPSGNARHYHPIAFWMGNKMFQNKPPLRHYPVYNEMLFPMMYVESYLNLEGRSFDYFRSQLWDQSGWDDRHRIIFESSNLFFSVSPRSTDDLLFRAHLIPGASQEHIKIHLPRHVGEADKTKLVEFVLDVNPTNIEIQSIKVGDRLIPSWIEVSDQIKFLVPDMPLDAILTLSHDGPSDFVKAIEIRNAAGPAQLQSRDNGLPNQLVKLRTLRKPCRFFINNPSAPDVSIYGTLDPERTVAIGLPFVNPEGLDGELTVTYLGFERNRAIRPRNTIQIDPNQDNTNSLVICP